MLADSLARVLVGTPHTGKEEKVIHERKKEGRKKRKKKKRKEKKKPLKYDDAGGLSVNLRPGNTRSLMPTPGLSHDEIIELEFNKTIIIFLSISSKGATTYTTPLIVCPSLKLKKKEKKLEVC